MSKITFYCLIVCICFSFFGCVKIPKECEVSSFQNQEVGVNRSVQKASQDPIYQEGNWPNTDWWVDFQDPQLTTLIEEAIEGNPDLQAAKFRIQSAVEAAYSTKSTLFPQLDAQFDTHYHHISKDSLLRLPPSSVPAVVNEINLALNFQYEFDFWGKNQNEYRAKLSVAKAKVAEEAQSKLLITTALAAVYMQFQCNQKLLQLQKEMIEIREQIYELIAMRVTNKLDDLIRLQYAEIEWNQAEEGIKNIEEAIEKNRTQIKLLMGLAPDEGRDIEAKKFFLQEAFTLPDNIPLELIRRRPDIMAQIWLVESKAHLIGAAKAAFYPSVNLLAVGGLNSLQWHDLFTHDSLKGGIKPIIQLPIFTGGKLRANLKEKVADFNEASQVYRSLILKAAKQVVDQITALQKVSSKLTLQQQVVLGSARNYDLVAYRFEEGIENYLSVMQEKEKLFHQKMAEVQLLQAKATAMIQLIKVLGGGYEAPRQTQFQEEKQQVNNP